MPRLELLVIVPGLLLIALVVFTLRRDDRLRLLLYGLAGVSAAFAAVLAWAALENLADHGLVIAFLLLILLANPAGAYGGVALAEATSREPLRRDGARQGALNGLYVAILLDLALGLMLDLQTVPLSFVLIVAGVMSVAAGALLGSEMALTRTMKPSAAATARKWLRGIPVLLVMFVLGVGAYQRFGDDWRRALRQEPILMRVGPLQVNDGLLQRLSSSDASVRATAARDLGAQLCPDGRTHDDRVVPALIEASADSDPTVRVAAVQGLGSAARFYGHRNREPFDALLELRNSPHSDVRSAAVQELRHLGVRNDVR